MRYLILVIFIVFVTDAESQLLLSGGVCTSDARSSLILQQVDENWNPIPFDCDNTRVLIENDVFKREIKPGEFRWCPAAIYKNTDHKKRISNPVTIMYENPGIYDVTVIRFDQVNQFKDVVIELDEGGCHAQLKRLEVLFTDGG